GDLQKRRHAALVPRLRQRALLHHRLHLRLQRRYLLPHQFQCGQCVIHFPQRIQHRREVLRRHLRGPPLLEVHRCQQLLPPKHRRQPSQRAPVTPRHLPPGEERPEGRTRQPQRRGEAQLREQVRLCCPHLRRLRVQL